MTDSRRLITRVAAIAATLVATLAFGAASASALLAQYSVPGPYLEQGTLTLSYDGQTKDCPVEAWAPGANQYLAAFTTSEACTGGGLFGFYSAFEVPSLLGGIARVGFTNQLGAESPWGPISGFSFQVPVANGNSSTPTKLVFSNTVLGSVYNTQSGSHPLYATGELTLTTPSGGLVTVDPR